MATDSKEVEVGCPCCRARLAVDVRTQRVVRWSRPEETDAAGRPVVGEADWRRAQERVAGRLEAAQDTFGAALDKEKRRTRDLDDLFREASKRARKGGQKEGEEGSRGPGGDSEADRGGAAEP